MGNDLHGAEALKIIRFKVRTDLVSGIRLEVMVGMIWLLSNTMLQTDAFLIFCPSRERAAFDHNNVR